MTHTETLSRLSKAGVVAVLRAPSADGAVHAAEVLVAGGVTAIEITYSTPNAADAIATLAQSKRPDVVLGAGTVMSGAQAAAAVSAGAEFVVTPGTTPPLARAVLDTGTTAIFGAFTPSEVMTVLDLGAHAVKVFPGSVGGPGYLKALRGPMPDVPIMPTGGVKADNVGEWFAAGAICVGAGGELCSARLITDEDWDEIERRAGEFAAAVASARG
ncbi:MAG: bifunctional 4-hydroxy-2-oxoglutarate aldolase/2-dehydro-3-deoxy-phosphogluconate aldolase [Acidimicrobiia bacterium]|nr:bifunctional 4-hydroxy-2-oxoglutarate aldolase/2-dehydro-3-deoxy-phosphogluconate aldolase [Acidimicrobiia bacterium]